jgi:p21-activated kinase 1
MLSTLKPFGIEYGPKGATSKVTPCKLSLLHNPSWRTEDERALLMCDTQPIRHAVPRFYFKRVELFMDTGSAKLYDATRRSDNKPVVIKKTPLRHEPELDAYVINEACMALLCSGGPGIVTSHTAYRTNDNVWIVMDRIHGSTLKKLAYYMPLSHSMIALIVRQILTSLQWLHARGVVHRDVKSTNIMVDSEGQVILIDFGFAVMQTKEHPNSRDPAGTLLFMAPEVCAGEE